MKNTKNNTDILSINSKNPMTLDSIDNEGLLVESAWRCIRQITSSMITLNNCFFTISDSNLIVLKTFLNKSSDKQVIGYIAENGTNLNEDVFGMNASFLAKKRNKTSILLKGEHGNKKSNDLVCISTPVNIKDHAVGYICLSSPAISKVNFLDIFMESLANNIKNQFIQSNLSLKIEKYLSIFADANKPVYGLNLSNREKLIANYLKMSSSNEKIANDFYISEATVKTYLKRIYEKCGTSNRTDTAIYLICRELLECM